MFPAEKSVSEFELADTCNVGKGFVPIAEATGIIHERPFGTHPSKCGRPLVYRVTEGKPGMSCN